MVLKFIFNYESIWSLHATEGRVNLLTALPTQPPEGGLSQGAESQVQLGPPGARDANWWRGHSKRRAAATADSWQSQPNCWPAPLVDQGQHNSRQHQYVTVVATAHSPRQQGRPALALGNLANHVLSHADDRAGSGAAQVPRGTWPPAPCCECEQTGQPVDRPVIVPRAKQQT